MVTTGTVITGTFTMAIDITGTVTTGTHITGRVTTGTDITDMITMGTDIIGRVTMGPVAGAAVMPSGWTGDRRATAHSPPLSPPDLTPRMSQDHVSP